MKSASGKRPPDEAHGPGKEAIRPQQRCLGKSRKESAHWHAALTAGTALHRSAFKNSAKFHQTFSHVCSFILKCLLFCNDGPKFTNFDGFFRNFSNFFFFFSSLQQFVRNFFRKYQNLLDRFSNFLGFRNEYF